MQCCCFNLFDEIGNKVFTWWLSWVFLCGVLACCISGFFTANRYGFSLYAFQCAYERIYYDSMYGQLKNTFPKWEGFNEINNVYKNLNNTYNSIISNITLNISLYYSPRDFISEKGNDSFTVNISNYFDYPMSKVFINGIYDAVNGSKPINWEKVNSSMKYININLYSTMRDIHQLQRNYQNIISNKDNYYNILSTIFTISQMDKNLFTYKSKIMEDFAYYVNVAMVMGKIVPLIYFSILLTFVVASGALLITYYCKEVNQQWWILPMHIAWNGIRFFIFSFFIYGCAYGMLFYYSRDLIGYLDFAFSKENINTDNMVILPKETKSFFNYCLYSNISETFANDASLNEFMKYAVNLDSVLETKPGYPKEADTQYQSFYDNLFKAIDANFSSFIKKNSFKKSIEYFKPIIKRGDSIYDNLDCGFVNNTVNLMYRAIWDFAWETRILCALSCCIGFFGAIAVYGFMWAMHLWKKDDINHYGYINNNNNYNNNNYNNYNNTMSPNNKKRLLKKAPPPEIDKEKSIELSEKQRESNNNSNSS